MGLSGVWLRLRHFIVSGGRHSIHSPFVYDWYNKVCLAEQGTWKQRMESFFGTVASTKNGKMIFLELDAFSGEMPKDCEVLVLTGIHQNKESYKKWMALQSTSTAEVGITLWQRGILIRRTGQVHQAFVLR